MNYTTPTLPDRRDTISHRLRRLGPLGSGLDRITTLCCGLAPSDRSPIIHWCRPTFYAAALAWLFGGTALSLWIITLPHAWWPLLIATLTLTAGGAHAVRLTIVHDAIHGAMESTTPAARRLYAAIGHVASALLMMQDFRSYADGHMIHHGEKFATAEDPDVQLLASLGIRPGMEYDELWERFDTLRWSPLFHARYAWYRIQAQLTSGSKVRGAIVGFAWLAILAGILYSGWMLPFAVAWLLPVFPLFQQSALEQFVTEHRWLALPDRSGATSTDIAKLSAGRFPLDPAPRTFGGWVRWWFRLALVHLPWRVRVVPFDLPHHDEHHLGGLDALRARGEDLPPWANWMNTAYARRLYEAKRMEDDPPLTSFYGREEAISATFAALSRLPSMDIPTLAAHHARSGMLGM